MLEVNHRISIPLKEFSYTFARSGGPGGQNVNKVNSKVTLHWDVTTSPSLPEDVRARFLAQYPRRINKEGQLVISSERFRDQGRNVTDCTNKLRELILVVATPPKKRRPTRPTKGSKERRLAGKREKSQKKQERGKNWRGE
ncbi:MAG: aminoacyl-tRNA hydrolase [Planctomycetaceae bacterium]|mgnify:CR=1 FL=1|nr:aminoacyl-tRNA hydrolase [Planctomycetales bacterium]MCB9873489.1 aminoacyl-tRNA hydrolase [Planctomycetaceae bacterium]MCB9940399.1 aminoacyl-tRNA hydrolase [Planctomycetaceae bacterium]HRX82595.1 alternative ribosome rescue aminoacyl-tRNA hydrolase ArfB [Pirellulaceae bacterium]